jgi:hypothetical protein
MTRARASALLAPAPATPAPAARARPARSDRREALDAMTGDVKLLLAVCALVLLSGFGYLIFGPRPQPMPSVLGYVDTPPPPVIRHHEPPGPPFKLPWWK